MDELDCADKDGKVTPEEFRTFFSNISRDLGADHLANAIIGLESVISSYVTSRYVAWQKGKGRVQ